jgi:hypothetical protein
MAAKPQQAEGARQKRCHLRPPHTAPPTSCHACHPPTKAAASCQQAEQVVRVAGVVR